MRVDLFDYELPEELIAQEPVVPRDASRLMIVHRGTSSIEHSEFLKIPSYLSPGDCMVFNDTRVIRGRLYGKRADTGGRVEVLLLEETEPNLWKALVKPGRRFTPGAVISFSGGALWARVVEKAEEGTRILHFADGKNPEEYGAVPLPPYIHTDLSEPERYQTIYARTKGSAAAPTAGLHFTDRVFEELDRRGVTRAFVTLHIGLDTFRPVKVNEVEEHKMHSERYWVSEAAAEAINRAHRVVAVGSTSVRVLETVSDAGGTVKAGSGSTMLFIYPGYRFKRVDALLTNFHLPRSTLLMMVSAFAGYDLIMEAYRQAVKERYRFFSFGDAMLIL